MDEEQEYDDKMDEEQEYYIDWLEDNSYRLRREFCEEREYEFDEYCKREFNNRERD